jgi:hypothetical protein
MQPRFHPGGRAHCFSLLAKLDCIELANPGSIIAKRTGAGTNQLTIGPDPNLVLTSYLVSRDTLHTSCALFCFVTGRRIPVRWTPLAEDTLFLGVFTKGN